MQNLDEVRMAFHVVRAVIGFLPVARMSGQGGLIEMLPPMREWAVPLRLFTHVDLHRSAKVQAGII